MKSNDLLGKTFGSITVNKIEKRDLMGRAFYVKIKTEINSLEDMMR